MKKKLAAVVAAASIIAGLAAVPASADPGNGNSCIGAVASETAHFSQQALGEGLGTYLHNLGMNPGQTIQAYDATHCDVTGG